MLDTHNEDLAPGVTARFRTPDETRRGIANSATFVETEAVNALAESGFCGSHTVPLTVSGAPREANSLLPRTTAKRKIFDNPCGDGSGIGDKNIARTVARRNSGHDKNSTLPRSFFCRISGKFQPTPTPPETILERSR